VQNRAQPPVSIDPLMQNITFDLLPLEHGSGGLGENDVRICSAQFEEVAGETATHNRLKPWKGRVVIIQSATGAVLYRLLRGLGNMSIPKGKVWLGLKTRSQLSVNDGGEISIRTIWQPAGRFLYYHNHLDDVVRFTFRIGVWGLLFAVLSIGLSIWQIIKAL